MKRKCLSICTRSRNNFRKVLSVIIVISIIIGLLSIKGNKVRADSTDTNNITTEMIDLVCDQYGYWHGTYWTDTGGVYRDRYGNILGYQCWAFARHLMFLTTGERPEEGGNWKRLSASSVTTLQMGDIVCLGDTVHTAVVYKHLGNGRYEFCQAEGSNNNRITKTSFQYYNSAGRACSASTLDELKAQGLQYVLRYYGNVDLWGSTLRIDNHNPVGTLAQGNIYTPSGVVRSNYTLRYCNAYIIKESAMNLVDGIHRLKDGASPEYASYNGSPGVSEYVLNGSSTMSGLHFENLSPGKYVFQVTAQDESEKAKYLVDEVFTVKAVQQDPKGWILAESNTCNTISVTGIAYYPDDMRKALDVHIYVGGPSGSGAPCYVCSASVYYPIETDISVDVNGSENIDVYAYAINDRGGNNTFLGKETVNVKSHLWDSGKTTKPATHSEDGIITYTCTSCHTTKTEPFGVGDWPFYDTPVRPGNWAYEGIKFVYGKGLMSGSTDKNGVATFRPKDNITRAEFVTILYRMAGSPKVYSNGNPFTDVKLKADGTKPYYYDAVVWAKVVGVITGYPDGTFRTKNNITRADMAVTLMRYASDQGIDTSNKANITGMPDYSNVPKYARDAVAWANAYGIITGREKSGVQYLAPRENAQRQECATILQRFYNAFEIE